MLSMQPRIIVCTGGDLDTWALQNIKQDDILIGADSGAKFLISAGLKPDIAIGDFDSVSEQELLMIRECSNQVISCDPIDKNYTDTEMAFRLALDMKPKEIVLLGALGTRFDHSLANVHLLSLAADHHIKASIIDRHNLIQVITTTTVIASNCYPNVSLLPLSAFVSGITLVGFQYPLLNARLVIGQSLGISNVLVAEEGKIYIREGQLLVIQSKD